MEFSCLPAWDGEVWLILSLADRKAAAEEALKALLTDRQREIMHWIAEGKTSAEAAKILEISPRTVEKHLEAVFQRLGVENRIAAVRNYLDIKAGQLV
jgi:DNA-binding CsgD family transcriptional regulator